MDVGDLCEVWEPPEMDTYHAPECAVVVHAPLHYARPGYLAARRAAAV